MGQLSLKNMHIVLQLFISKFVLKFSFFLFRTQQKFFLFLARCRSQHFRAYFLRGKTSIRLWQRCPFLCAGFDDRIRQEIEQNICAEGGPGLDCFALPLELIARYLEQV
jgi:hypothetical protein